MHCLINLYNDSMKELVAPVPVYPLGIKARPKDVKASAQGDKVFDRAEVRTETRHF